MNRMMKALTLWQPWASLYISRAKPLETRDWAPPTWLIGHRIGIHAAKRPTLKCLEEEAVPDEIVTAMATALEKFLGIDSLLLAELPVGAMLGTVRLKGVYRVRAWDPESRRANVVPLGASPSLTELPTDDFGNFMPGRYLWDADEAERFPTPIPARGGRKLWDWEQPACAA